MKSGSLRWTLVALTLTACSGGARRCPTSPAPAAPALPASGSSAQRSAALAPTASAPPTPEAAPASPPVQPPWEAPVSSAASSAPPPPAQEPPPAPEASPSPAAPAPSAPELSPALTDAGGAWLPQTDERPRSDSPFVKAQAALLWQAIVEDRPALARSFFFPQAAYAKVKDIQRPERDWSHRLYAAFERDVHAFHRRLGADRARLSFLGLEVDEARAKWMKPGSEGNKLGYYRVLRSRLAYRLPDGRRAHLELTSLISWRGEWYVVHLDGFK